MNNNAAALPIALLSQSSTGREQSHYVLLLGDNSQQINIYVVQMVIFSRTPETQADLVGATVRSAKTILIS